MTDTVRTAADFASLDMAIQNLDSTTIAGSYTISITGTIDETNDLYAFNLASGVDVTIIGNGGTLDGAHQYEGLFVYQGNVTVENLTIADAAAIGGAGAVRAGGGAGLGGGLFVAGPNAEAVGSSTFTTGGSVTLENVNFSGDSATGGAGGAPGSSGTGGGGGLNGGTVAGGQAGGGGGVGLDAVSTGAADGNPGIILGALGGGSGYPSGTNSEGGSAGGGGGGGSSGGSTVGGGGGGGGGGGVGGAPGGPNTSGAGGFGGGSGYAINGHAAAGGFGGGGGGGFNGSGGAGGFGGGGSGGTYGFGNGGFGAGNGSSSGNGTGGGGLGAGGDIFVQQGGTLTVEGGSLGLGTVTAGTASNAQVGSAFGSGIFLQGNQSQTLETLAATTLTVSGVIADESGSTGGSGGSSGLIIGGTGYTGTVTLDATNTYTGGTTIEDGTLVLSAAGAAGSGAITFGLGDPPSLAFTVADAPTNTIDNFGASDTIDITDLAYSTSGTALWSDGTLTITEGSTSLTLDIAGSYTAQEFILASDGATGTLVTVCYYPGTGIRTPSRDVAVESLAIGDAVVTSDGRALPVRWIGRNTVSTRFADPLRVLPIRIRAGALAEGLPERDLLVSPEHALLVEDILIQAGALVNGLSIIRERDVPATFTYYHVELAEHALLIAEGTPAETFVDNIHRSAFDNWAEHEALYGDAPITEMSLPRAQSHRQVPVEIHQRLMTRAGAIRHAA
jgi:hypothetical protein